MKTKTKTKIKDFFSKALKHFGNISFIVGIVVVVIITFSTPRGAMRNIFGVGVARIESGSMVERGFAIGDVVFMNKKFDNPLKKGDVIGFYNKQDAFDLQTYNINANQMENSDLVLVDEYEGEFASNISYANRTKPETLLSQNYRIVFHEIIEVYVSPEGIVFYQTKGSNPTSVPDGFIRQDFVQAKYMHTPGFLKLIMSFAITPIGVTLLLIAPLSLVIGFDGYVIFKKIYTYNLEIKVFNRKISFKNPKVKEYKVSALMSTPRKAYFWITTERKEKDDAFKFLFPQINAEDKKEMKERENALTARRIFEEKGPLEYFKFWHLTVDKYFDKKEVIKFQKQYQNWVKNNKE